MIRPVPNDTLAQLMLGKAMVVAADDHSMRVPDPGEESQFLLERELVQPPSYLFLQWRHDRMQLGFDDWIGFAFVIIDDLDRGALNLVFQLLKCRYKFFAIRLVGFKILDAKARGMSINRKAIEHVGEDGERENGDHGIDSL